MPEDKAKRVLVVSDAPDEGEIEALCEAGYQTDTVRSVDEAAGRLTSGVYSQVLAEPRALPVLCHPCVNEDLEALRASEEMYRGFIERSNDGVVVLQDRVIRYANPRFAEMSGFSAEVLLDHDFTSFIPPDEAKKHAELYMRRMAGEPMPSLYETAMTRRDGVRLPLEISGAVISFEGRPADLVLVRDITIRKTAEECLERYGLLSEHARDVVLFIQFDGQVVKANLAAVEAYGFSREELLRLNIRDLKPTSERSMVDDMVERLRRESILFETVHMRKDGSVFPVEVHAGSAASDDEFLILAVIRDISDRKRAEADLAAALEEARREGYRAAALQSIAEAGLSTLRLPELLDTLVERIAEVLGADSSCVFVLDEVTGMFEAHAAHNVPGLVGVRVRADEGLIGKVARERRPIYVRDAEHDALSMDDPFVKGAKALLGVPLIARGKVIGVTRIQSLVSREFSEDEVRLLQAIAESVAVAIDNARLYDALQHSQSDIQEAFDKEKHFSLLLQRALLPETPSIGEGYEVAVRYVPVFFGREIGGDFYDVFTVADGRAGILIGDVSGKGLEAASLAATTRSTIHAFVHETAAGADVLTRANSVLYSQQPSTESFVTVALATLDMSTGKICCASAGHPPMAFLRADGRVEFVSSTSLPLGVMRDHAYQCNQCRLDPGDKLVLYTDGISEARAGSGMFDTAGIERTLSGHGDWTAEQIAASLIDAATEWAHGKLLDDAAVIVVSRTR